jgi:hypothetical protein
MRYNYKRMAEGIKSFIELDQDILEYMRQPKFRRADVDIEARILHHWDKQEVLLEKNKTGAWFNFSLVEAFWLKLIEKMRQYNLRLELIREIKNGLHACNFDINDNDIKQQIKELILNMDNIEDHNSIDEILSTFDVGALIKKQQFTLLESILVQIILTRKNFRLLLNAEGDFFIEDTSAPELYLTDEEYQKFINKTYLNISLNEIIFDLVTDLGFHDSADKINILSKEEAHVLELMKQEDIDQITIKFNRQKNKPKIIEVSKINQVSEAVRLQELILKNGYQEITVKTQNGKIAYCENTTKYKLDTE